MIGVGWFQAMHEEIPRIRQRIVTEVLLSIFDVKIYQSFETSGYCRKLG